MYQKVFFLDDERTPDSHLLEQGVLTIVRKAELAFYMLETVKYDYYYFDHDLGSVSPKNTGYDILTYALETDLIPKESKVKLITNNPVGRMRMKDALENHGFKESGGFFRYVK